MNSRKRSRSGTLIENSADNLASATRNAADLDEIIDLTHESDNSIKLSDSSKTSEDKNPALLDELEEEIERQLESKARKNNLSVSNVKNMIKAVITSQDVLTLMDFNLNVSEEKPPYEPKLTRAKTRELLAKESAQSKWPLSESPRKSDIAELINKDLAPDDSSDEEYCPLEECTDEESKLDESFIEEELLRSVVKPISDFSSNDFPRNINSDGSIGQRTRSKLCLSETPLETIEQAFIPPDITTDMYATNCENPDWLDFLKEFSQPLCKSEQNEMNDDDNDPEYNVMVDEEHEGTDREELRMDRAVKVSKKELNSLFTEIYEYNAQLSSEDEENANMEGKFDGMAGFENMDNSDIEFLDADFDRFGNRGKEHRKDTKVYYDNDMSSYVINEEMVIFDEQRLLLEQQMRQHVQQLLINFLLSHGHPTIHCSYAVTFKNMLLFWNKIDRVIAKVPNVQATANIRCSIELMNRWETIIKDPTMKGNITRFLLMEMDIAKRYKKKKLCHKPEIPSELIKICRESRAFMYPLMLPSNGFSSVRVSNTGLSDAEINLITFGLHEYCTIHGIEDADIIKGELPKIADYISKYKTPGWSKSTIQHFINRSRISKKGNPIKAYLKDKELPKISHYVIPLPNKMYRLYEHSPVLLPEKWRIYLKNISSAVAEAKRKSL